MAPRTRQDFTEELARLEQATLEGLDMVVEQTDRVLEALEHQDVELAEIVVGDDNRLNGRYLEIHQSVLTLLALQAPVAGDLRLVAAILHSIKHIERMGNQCVNIAKMIPLVGHEPPRNAEMLAQILKMGRSARSEVAQVRQAFAMRDVGLAQDLVRQDRAVNLLNKDIFRMAVEIGEDHDTREWAMSMTMVARAFERLGDNAVDVGEQVSFMVDGSFRDFETTPEAPSSAR